MEVKPSLEENRRKIANFFGETRFEVEVKSPTPSQWNIAVSSIASLMQLAKRHGLAAKKSLMNILKS